MTTIAAILNFGKKWRVDISISASAQLNGNLLFWLSLRMGRYFQWYQVIKWLGARASILTNLGCNYFATCLS